MEGIILFPLRLMNFAVGFLACWMERAAEWFVGVRKRTEYVREGACKRCGRCCQAIALLVPKGVSKRGWLVGVFRAWHRLAMNFRMVGEEEGWLVYRCGYYDESRGGCTVYPFRHRICRFFPWQRLYGKPSLHPDCGFRFVRRDVAAKVVDARKASKTVFDDVIRKKERLSPQELSHIEIERCES